MGNCQAIENATLVIQHPNGKHVRLYRPIVATQIMNTNPGHYVALLLTTIVYSSATADGNNIPPRVTRIKLLRPTDTLLLGHLYRLVTAEEVKRGLVAKKQQSGDVEMTKQAKHGGHKSRNGTSSVISAVSRSKAWQPSLNSISESGN